MTDLSSVLYNCVHLFVRASPSNMKAVAVVVLLACTLVHGFELQKEWDLWKEKYGKKYDCDHMELSRRTIWSANKVFVDTHNANAKIHGYTVEMNEFADLDNAEFARIYNGYKGIPGMNRSGSTYLPPQSMKDLPTSVDWRTKGVVTGIKNQGQCGSCWAFSTTGSLEGQHALKTGKLVSLSEQQLVDCSGSFGNEGCNGGLMDNAFKYIMENKGDDTEASYPYEGVDGKCHFNPDTVGATDTGYTDVKSKDETALQTAVANVGPISCAMDASHLSFQLYHSGVYDPLICSQTRLDHGVLAVGYGVDGDKDYWIVKNSWGTSWGQKGYFWLARNKDNKCGIATSSSYPLV